MEMIVEILCRGHRLIDGRSKKYIRNLVGKYIVNFGARSILSIRTDKESSRVYTVFWIRREGGRDRGRRRLVKCRKKIFFWREL